MTSIMECCFINTVEIDIKNAAIPNESLKPGEENLSVSQAASMAATEPITWMDGQTFVLVSNS